MGRFLVAVALLTVCVFAALAGFLAGVWLLVRYVPW